MKLLANLMIIGQVARAQENQGGIPQVQDDDVETRSSLLPDDLARGKNKKKRLQEEAERKAAEEAAKATAPPPPPPSVFDNEEGSSGGFANMFQGMDMSQFDSLYNYDLEPEAPVEAPVEAPLVAAAEPVVEEAPVIENLVMEDYESYESSGGYAFTTQDPTTTAEPTTTATTTTEQPTTTSTTTTSTTTEEPTTTTTTTTTTSTTTEEPTTTTSTTTTTTEEPTTTTSTTTTTTEEPTTTTSTTTTTTEEPTTTTSTTTTTTEEPTTTSTTTTSTTTTTTEEPTTTTSTTTTTTEEPTTTTSTTTTTTEEPTTTTSTTTSTTTTTTTTSTTTEEPTTTSTTTTTTTTTTEAPTTTTTAAPACDDGYEYNGSECVDINECNAGTYECEGENTVCVNTLGSYKCKCSDGFVKNKLGVCRDINECKRDNKCHRRATCTNTPGSYSCECPGGMTGNGFKCSPKNPCEDGTAGCDDNATCTTGPKTDDGSLSFTCECNEGFEGDGYFCADPSTTTTTELPTTTSTGATTTTTYSTTVSTTVAPVDAESLEANFANNAAFAEADRGSDFVSNQDGTAFGASGLDNFLAGSDYDYSAPATNFLSTANTDFFNYDDPFTGLSASGSDFLAGDGGKIGTNTVGTADNNDTLFWAYMHSMWNHYQDSRRHWKEAAGARYFNHQSSHDVTNNLRSGALLNAGRDLEDTAYAHEGLSGKDLYDIDSTLTAGHKPWELTNSEVSATRRANARARGFAHPSATSFDEMVFNPADFDSSWELGTPTNAQRWFKQTNVSGGGTNEASDTARLSCITCNVQYKLQWDPAARQFFTASSTGAVNSNAWADCGSASQACEYSSGVCFIEERRTWGYITLVRKGCKQAQACYMQKYQNFLVQAGRQCWPKSTALMKVASRPSDIKADEWIYNIVKGAKENPSVAYNKDFDGINIDASFDSTFTDNAGLTGGFYVDPVLQPNLYQQYAGLTYVNGMVEASRCTQCCNTSNDCNTFEPVTEADWAKSYAL